MNVPQLCLQVLYTAEIDEIEDYVIVAFLASILAVFISTLSYLIGRDGKKDDKLTNEKHEAGKAEL